MDAARPRREMAAGGGVDITISGIRVMGFAGRG
jgi:hypothetical protein